MDDILWRMRDWVPGHGVEFELSETWNRDTTQQYFDYIIPLP